MCYTSDGDLMLLHRFEERGLHFWRRSIDFISQDDVRHDRSHLGIEFLGFAIVDLAADDVCREKIWRELDSFEFQTEELSEDVDGFCFRQSGEPFDEDMASAEDIYYYCIDEVIHTDDMLVDMLFEYFQLRSMEC